MDTALPPVLPAVARAAWAAYDAMRASKAAHIEFLLMVDRKVQDGGRRSLAEIAHLEQLLAEHTLAVAHFRDELTKLAGRDPAARDQLIACLTRK